MLARRADLLPAGGDRLGKGWFNRRKALFKHSDSAPEIVSTRCQCSGEDRIGRVGAVKYAGTFLFGGDVALKETDGAIKVVHHSPDHRGFSKRSCIRNLKMTLVFHLRAPK
jgi:hypothetical protein